MSSNSQNISCSQKKHTLFCCLPKPLSKVQADFFTFFPSKKGKGSGSIKLRLPVLFFCMKHNWLLQIMDTVWLYVMLDESKKGNLCLNKPFVYTSKWKRFDNRLHSCMISRCTSLSVIHDFGDCLLIVVNVAAIFRFQWSVVFIFFTFWCLQARKKEGNLWKENTKIIPVNIILILQVPQNRSQPIFCFCNLSKNS